MGFVGDAAKGVAGGMLPGAGFAAMGKGGNAPSTPDFNAAATPNQTNAFGATSSYSMGPDGRMNQTQGFNGPMGGAVQGLEGQLASGFGSPLPGGDAARQAASNAIYGQETSRLDPRFQQGEHDLQTRLANQGIDPASAAYQREMDNFNRAKNDAYQQANFGSIIGGGQEAQRNQQMDLASRFAPLQALQGIGGLTGQSANPLLPAAIAQYQGGLQKYGIDQAGKNSTMGGLANLGGSLGMAAMLAGGA